MEGVAVDRLLKEAVDLSIVLAMGLTKESISAAGRAFADVFAQGLQTGMHLDRSLTDEFEELLRKTVGHCRNAMVDAAHDSGRERRGSHPQSSARTCCGRGSSCSYCRSFGLAASDCGRAARVRSLRSRKPLRKLRKSPPRWCQSRSPRNTWNEQPLREARGKNSYSSSPSDHASRMTLRISFVLVTDSRARSDPRN